MQEYVYVRDGPGVFLVLIMDPVFERLCSDSMTVTLMHVPWSLINTHTHRYTHSPPLTPWALWCVSQATAHLGKFTFIDHHTHTHTHINNTACCTLHKTQGYARAMPVNSLSVPINEVFMKHLVECEELVCYTDALHGQHKAVLIFYCLCWCFTHTFRCCQHWVSAMLISAWSELCLFSFLLHLLS